MEKANGVEIELAVCLKHARRDHFYSSWRTLRLGISTEGKRGSCSGDAGDNTLTKSLPPASHTPIWYATETYRLV